MLLGHENLLLVFISALWAFGYGMLTGRPGGYGWVGQQCVITFLVASAFPASLGRRGRPRLCFSSQAERSQLVLSSIALRLFHDLHRRLFDQRLYP